MIIKKFIKDCSEIKDTSFKKGCLGEKEVAYFLDFELGASKISAIIHDFEFTIDGNKTQIDHLVITPAVCYVIETKYRKGVVDIDKNENWIASYSSDKKYPMSSPVTQNRRHILALEKLFKEKSIIRRATGDNYSLFFENVVMFTDDTIINNKSSIKNIYQADSLFKAQDRFVWKTLLNPIKFLKVFFRIHKMIPRSKSIDVAKLLLAYDENPIIEENSVISITEVQKNQEAILRSQMVLQHSCTNVKKELQDLRLLIVNRNQLSTVNSKKTTVNKSFIYQKLESFRTQKALSKNVAPFVILQDCVLLAISNKKPQNKEELLAIKGFGLTKWSQYGLDILKTLED